MSISRRDICLLLPAAFFAAAVKAEKGSASEQGEVLPSKTYAFDGLPVHTAPTGAQIRNMFKGKLATGESVEVHETTLPPGAMPHAAHHHPHSEMWLVREGIVELTINGASQQFGAGSVGFVKSNDEHGIKNVGTTPATYFVVAMGRGAGGA